ncbi:MAG: metallophosphoesterase [Dehalococcoidia bacterium]|nr:metallophosphoesterase [Dehalococcoidia bacterium]
MWNKYFFTLTGITKKFLPAIMAFTGALFITAFVVWAFSLHGTSGLFHVNGIFHTIFILLFISIGILLALGISYICFSSRLKPLTYRLFTIVTITFALPNLIAPPLTYAYTSGYFSGSIGDTPPQLIMTAASGVYGLPNLALTFNSAQPTCNTIVWGTTENSISITEEKSSRQHVFILHDLQPSTSYTYRINNGSSSSFTTPSADGVLHFAVCSDAHFGAGNNHSDLTAAMLQSIANPANHYNLLFSLGDLVDYGFSASQWHEAFSAFSATTSSIPALFALGNHDSVFTGINLYKEYAHPADIGVANHSQLWHRIDIGKIHFLVLDIEWSAESYTPVQAAWLEAQLKDIPVDDWKIVMGHGFYYSSGSTKTGWDWFDNPETINSLTPLFEKYGVDIVFSGHNHQMELLQHNGVTYVICGAFGGRPNQIRDYTSPASLWYQHEQYGFVDVSLSGNQCSITFRDNEYQALKTLTIEKK